MKQLSWAHAGYVGSLSVLPRKNKFNFFLVSLVCSFLFISCQKQELTLPEEATEPTMSREIPERNPVPYYQGLGTQTVWELQQARAATARYHNIENAYADEYADISVVVPNMGHHFLKATILDAAFDITKPEILVYNVDENGNFDLVAVEYAIPLSLSANAPAGFTGSSDVWDENTSFGLWLLHAWVWEYNPSGVFNPTNPNVHLH